MAIICAQWNHDGSILAIGGVQIIEDKEINLVHFYNPSGEVLYISSISFLPFEFYVQKNKNLLNNLKILKLHFYF